MKKMIPVTLILFLCLLVAFAFLCEKVPLSFGHADTMWIAVYAGGSYQVRNEKGQVLLYEDGACNGDMPVYETTCDYLAESPLDYFRVPYARELRVTCGRQYGQGGLPCGLGRQVPEAVWQRDRNGPDDAGRGEYLRHGDDL